MIRLEAHGWRALLAPGHGASLTALEVRHPATGGWLPVLAPLADPAAGLTAGCFVMAPFANRIADGRFSFAGRDHRIALNRPAEGMAIHGCARDRAWRVIEAGKAAATLALHLDEPGCPWRFDLEQRLTLAEGGATIALTLTNRGAAPMPFGIGLHPWFPKAADTMLHFTTAALHRRDARGLPLPQTDPLPALAAGSAQPLAQIPWLDGCASDWTPREAWITGGGLRITLQATGALRHLHVYIPDDRPLFCAEPVSHLPDAINRPGLPGAMTVLAPGATLAGAMTLAAAFTAPPIAPHHDRSPSDDPQDL